MTLFILGIFTGIGIAILWGHYLNNQRKKEQRKEVEAMLKYASEVFDKLWVEKVVSDHRTPQQQLQDAIDREGFKEAARLRDLINRK